MPRPSRDCVSCSICWRPGRSIRTSIGGPMIFRETALRGACVIELEPHTDDRGQFVRTWCREEFVSHGLDVEFAQRSVSINPDRGTGRGLSWYAAPPPAAHTMPVS